MARRNIRFAVPDLQKAIEGVGKKLGQQFYKDVVQATPIAPINGGNARRRWSKPANKPNWTMKNTAPYIGMLDQGWSKQAQAGYIQATMKKTIKDTKI